MGEFIYPVDFVVIETESVANPDAQIPVILGRPFSSFVGGEIISPPQEFINSFEIFSNWVKSARMATNLPDFVGLKRPNCCINRGSER